MFSSRFLAAFTDEHTKNVRIIMKCEVKWQISHVRMLLLSKVDVLFVYIFKYNLRLIMFIRLRDGVCCLSGRMHVISKIWLFLNDYGTPYFFATLPWLYT